MNEIIKTDKIDHIGMVVPDIEKALEHYKNVFNKIGSKPIISETQNISLDTQSTAIKSRHPKYKFRHPK